MVRSKFSQITIALDDALRERAWSYDTTEKVKTMLMNEKDANLKSLRKKYEGTLLHMAVCYGAPVDVLQVILEKIPETARMTTKKGKQTALHWGMDGKASADAIELVLKANPQAAKLRDTNGRLPLHLGMYRRASLEAIKAVLEAYPDATRIQDRYGQTPLHSGVSIGLKQMLKASRVWFREPIELVMKRDPHAAEIKDKRGRTPLHILLENGASVSLVMTVVEACPSSLDVRDKLGRTTLHAAVANGAPAHVLAAIMERYPSKAICGDVEGRKTLAHLIMEKKESAGAVWAILKAYQSNSNDSQLSYKDIDVNGQTPLHIGMVHGVSAAAITAVLDAFPEAATMVDNLGQTPLALGIGFEASLESVLPVLRSFPNAAKLVDSSGNTPLHLGISKTIPCDIIEAMLVECPGSGITPNTDGLHPLHHAIQQESPDIEIVSTILRCCPKAAKTRDLDGNTPLLCLLTKAYGNDVRATSFPPVIQMKAVTQIWTMLCDAQPLAAEIENYAGISPIGFLVSLCSMSTVKPASPRGKQNSSQGFNRSLTFLQLRALLKGLRDGRPLRKLCSLQFPDSLNLFLALFSQTTTNDQLQTTTGRHKQQQIHMTTIDLNQEHVRGWTLLEILADLDNDDACSILLQIVEEQKTKLRESDSTISIRCRHDTIKPIAFRSKAAVREDTMRKVADRARLSVGSERLRQWGRVYGRFLRRYQIDKHKEPKHISETCVVVFATETRLDESGRQYEQLVALKFLPDLDAFCREIDMRGIIARSGRPTGSCDDDGQYTSDCHPSVVPILACYTSRLQSEIQYCDAIKFASPALEFSADFSELKNYEHIRLQSTGVQGLPRDLQYLLVMECGAGLDLNDVISHQNIAGRDLPMVLSIGTGIAKCLQFLNEDCRIVHGDVKARNFISLGVGAGYAAIDLDNAASIANGDVVGKKRTSSGYMPPEQVAIEALRRRQGDANAEITLPAVLSELKDLENKLQVAIDGGNYDEQLRLLQVHRDSQCRVEQLQNGDFTATPVRASPQYDMWCFGVLLYYLCTGVQLFNMDFREDVNDMDLASIRNWNKDDLLSKLKFVPEGWPRSLVADLLQPVPSHRPTAWKDVISKLQTVQSNPRQWGLPVAEDPCMWSITYWQLMEVDQYASDMFEDEYPSMTMRDIAAKIITPRCKTSGSSFALALNPAGLMVDAFVTHSWDEPFHAFVGSIRKVFQTSVVKPNLWICAFALDQSDVEVVEAQVGSELTPLASSPFVKALGHALSFVVVRNSTTDLYSRIWCVCECIYAKKLGLVPNKTHVTGPNTFSHRKTSCLHAQSTNPEDKARILQVLLLEHNVEEIDDIVQLFRTQETPE